MTSDRIASAAASTPSSKVPIAIFGNGFARSVILPALQNVPEAEVVGIASPNLERVTDTATEFNIAHACSDHRELLDRCQPALVFVVTPPHRHLEQTVDALGAQCHVVCEKPTALNAQESAQMAQLAERHSDRLCIIDHELRLDPRRRQIRQWIQSGRLGTLRHAHYVLHSPAMRDRQRPWGWWHDASCGGGLLGAVGSHAVDALRQLLGEVRRVSAQLHTFTKDRRTDAGDMRPVTTDDYAHLNLEFDDGILATVTLSAVEVERRHSLTLVGDKGGVILEEQTPLRVTFGDAPPTPFEVEEELPSNAELHIPNTDWARNFVRLARTVVAKIVDPSSADAKRVTELADFEEGHRNQVVIDTARRSARQRCWLEVPS